MFPVRVYPVLAALRGSIACESNQNGREVNTLADKSCSFRSRCLKGRITLSKVPAEVTMCLQRLECQRTDFNQQRSEMRLISFRKKRFLPRVKKHVNHQNVNIQRSFNVTISFLICVVHISHQSTQASSYSFVHGDQLDISLNYLQNYLRFSDSSILQPWLTSSKNTLSKGRK